MLIVGRWKEKFSQSCEQEIGSLVEVHRAAIRKAEEENALLRARLEMAGEGCGQPRAGNNGQAMDVRGAFDMRGTFNMLLKSGVRLN